MRIRATGEVLVESASPAGDPRRTGCLARHVGLWRWLLGVALVGGCVASPSPARAQSVSGWSVGDSWKVGTWRGQLHKTGSGAPATQKAYSLKGQMIAVTFEVAGAVTIGDTACYEVRVTFPQEDTGFQRRYVAYYSRVTSRLVRIHDVSLRPNGQTKDVVTDFPADASGPTLLADVPSLVPLDWPDASSQNVPARQTRSLSAAQATTAANVRTTGGAVQRENTIAMTAKVGEGNVEVTQRWRPGERWWREAKRYENDQLVSEAVLLEVNGTKVADAADASQP